MILFLTACGGQHDAVSLPEDAVTEDTALEEARHNGPHWWATCGDPVCQGWTPKGLPGCSTHDAGERCARSLRGYECDPYDDCNSTLICQRRDPTDGGNCPRSKREYKDDVRYLGAEDQEKLAAELMAYRLATWHYKPSVADPGPEHVGFLIDDVAPSASVMQDGEHVDLYGYASMAVAALQVQQRQIEALQAQVDALRQQLDASAPGADTPLSPLADGSLRARQPGPEAPADGLPVGTCPR